MHEERKRASDRIEALEHELKQLRQLCEEQSHSLMISAEKEAERKKMDE